MKILRKSFVTAFLACLSFSLMAQEQEKEWLPVSVSVFNESTAVPFTRFLPTPLHPGIQAGVSRQWNNSQKHYLYQTANLSYFYHRYLYQAATLSTELGYDFRFPFGLNLKALFGVGYMLAMNTQEVYEFNGGEYTSTVNSLMSKFQTTFSLGVGYRIFKDKEGSPEVFFLYQAGVIYPFSADFIPVMAQANVHLGVKVPIKVR